MSNHGFIHSRRHFKFEEVDAIIRKSAEKFEGFLKVESYREKDYSGWEIEFTHDKIWFSFPLWIESPRIIEHAHKSSGILFWWVMHYITNEIALAYDGYGTDEGLSPEEKFHPVPGKYDSLRDFMNLMHSNPDGKIVMMIVKMTLKYQVPKDLRKRFMKK